MKKRVLIFVLIVAAILIYSTIAGWVWSDVFWILLLLFVVPIVAVAIFLDEDVLELVMKKQHIKRLYKLPQARFIGKIVKVNFRSVIFENESGQQLKVRGIDFREVNRGIVNYEAVWDFYYRKGKKHNYFDSLVLNSQP